MRTSFLIEPLLLALAPHWPEFLTLAAIVVLIIAAALQAGVPRPWSWRRFAFTTLFLTALLAAAIAAGTLLVNYRGEHSAMRAVCIVAGAVAVAGSLIGVAWRRRTSSRPQEDRQE